MSSETKKNLEIAALILSLALAAIAGLKAWALTPYRIDELAASQAGTVQRVESLQRDQNVLSSEIRVQLATITEGQKAFRRDIDDIKSDLKDIKAKK